VNVALPDLVNRSRLTESTLPKSQVLSLVLDAVFISVSDCPDPIVGWIVLGGTKLKVLSSSLLYFVCNFLLLYF
jgi:hypothetical protein